MSRWYWRRGFRSRLPRPSPPEARFAGNRGVAALPILRNAVVGLHEVDRAVVESARGIGMSPLRTALTIELPLAWPVILAGVRTSAQMAMGIAAVADYALGPGMDVFIFSGLSRQPRRSELVRGVRRMRREGLITAP